MRTSQMSRVVLCIVDMALSEGYRDIVLQDVKGLGVGVECHHGGY
jgi:hypothetical protein